MNIFTIHLKVQQYLILFRQIRLIKKNLRNLLFLKGGYDFMERALITQVETLIESRKEVT
jgi:hypothetical protein